MFCEIKGIYTSAFEVQLINHQFTDAQIILFYNTELYLFFAISMIYVYTWIWTTCIDFTRNWKKLFVALLAWYEPVFYFTNQLKQVSVISQLFLKLLTWFGFKGVGWLWPFSDYFNLLKRRAQYNDMTNIQILNQKCLEFFFLLNLSNIRWSFCWPSSLLNIFNLLLPELTLKRLALSSIEMWIECFKSKDVYSSFVNFKISTIC